MCYHSMIQCRSLHCKFKLQDNECPLCLLGSENTIIFSILLQLSSRVLRSTLYIHHPISRLILFLSTVDRKLLNHRGRVSFLFNTTDTIKSMVLTHYHNIYALLSHSNTFWVEISQDWALYTRWPMPGLTPLLPGAMICYAGAKSYLTSLFCETRRET